MLGLVLSTGEREVCKPVGFLPPKAQRLNLKSCASPPHSPSLPVRKLAMLIEHPKEKKKIVEGGKTKKKRTSQTKYTKLAVQT